MMFLEYNSTTRIRDYILPHMTIKNNNIPRKDTLTEDLKNTRNTQAFCEILWIKRLFRRARIKHGL